MGAWGPGVFSDDVALEVRDVYRDLIGDGHTAAEAAEAVLANWKDFLDDPDTGHVVWLALAVTQWKLGRLDDTTRAKALAAIDNGAALEPWKVDPKALRQRRAVLTDVRRQLESPPPAPRKVKRRFRDTCDWQIGELIGYRTATGRFVVFRVADHHTDRGGTSPIMELLDWIGDALPSAEQFAGVPIRVAADLGLGRPSRIFIGRLRAKELPADRLFRLGVISPPTQPPGWAILGASWKTLDSQLRNSFGI
jgi:hypothetical protein